MYAAIIAIAFSLWFALSCANQVPKFSACIAPFDRFGLLPKWTFFAPNPGTHDSHLVYRTCQHDEDLSDPSLWSANMSKWCNADNLHVDLGVPFVWNPHRRITKTISDLINVLVVFLHKKPQATRFVVLSIEYILLTHLVMQDVPPGARLVQWAIVRSRGFGDKRVTRIIFLSQVHRIASNVGA